MNLNTNEFRDKVLACWMGKNIGGTLGAPFEWHRQMNHVEFYTQDLGGEPLPNDDLDIQLLWLVALEEKGIELNAQILADYWTQYVTPHWSEYGTAKINMRAGLLPPLSGTFGNAFKDSCGAFIRSEIWACIAPGNPHLAARYAYEDAILDHGNGEGTWAEIFCAALESAAFVISDIDTLIEIGMSFIPENCGVAGAIRCAQESFRAGKSWQEARDKMLADWRGEIIFGQEWTLSAEDRAKGFGPGKRGWDVPSNIGMLLIGLLYGGGDFEKTICTAVNCGEDTDCTGATVGSIFGILHGMAGIPERWIAPIGRKIKTACLNLGELGAWGAQLPQDVDNLTDRTLAIARQVALRHHPALAVDERPTDLAGVSTEAFKAGALREELAANMSGPVFRFADFAVQVNYGEDGAVIRPGQPKAVQLRIRNVGKFQAQIALRWYLPEGVRIAPAPTGALLSLPGHFGQTPVEPVFTLEADAIREPLLRAAVELTLAGRSTVMLVPVALMNGSLL